MLYTWHLLCSACECCSATVEPHLERFVVRVQGWFDATEPSLCTAVQGKQGVPSHLFGIGSKRFNVPYLVPKNPVHTGSCSKESNHEQTTLTAACLGCTVSYDGVDFGTFTFDVLSWKLVAISKVYSASFGRCWTSFRCCRQREWCKFCL